MLDFTNAKTAEDVFRIAKKADPERYARLETEHPISSADDDYRHRFGERRSHRSTGEITRYVAADMRRLFTDDEWAATWAAWKQGELDHNAIERVAHELAAEGIRGY